jgi:hypothetical protein
MKETNRAHRVHHYCSNTATGPLQRHLIKCHYDQWTSGCKERNLSIRSVAGQEAIALHEGETSKPQTSSRPLYSPELFLDALVDFIVANDLVLFLFLFFYSFFLICFS